MNSFDDYSQTKTLTCEQSHKLPQLNSMDICPLILLNIRTYAIMLMVSKTWNIIIPQSDAARIILSGHPQMYAACTEHNESSTNFHQIIMKLNKPRVWNDMFCGYLKQTNSLDEIKDLVKITGRSFDCIPPKDLKNLKFCKKVASCKNLFDGYLDSCVMGENKMWADFIHVLAVHNDHKHLHKFFGACCCESLPFIFASSVNANYDCVVRYMLENVTAFHVDASVLHLAIYMEWRDDVCEKIADRTTTCDMIDVSKLLTVCVIFDKLKILITILSVDAIIKALDIPICWGFDRCEKYDDDNIKYLQTIFKILRTHGKITKRHYRLIVQQKIMKSGSFHNFNFGESFVNR